MSHFIGICFTFGGQAVLDMNLEPYDEQTEDEAYLEFVDCTEDLKTEFEELPEVDDKVYDNGTRRDKDRTHYPTLEQFADEWFGYQQNEDGRYGYTTNPNAKWDWYSVGNRWDGYLKGKNGQEYNRLKFDDVDWDKTRIPFCFVDTDGNWNEVGEMGWFACVSNEKDEDVWADEFKAYVKSLQDLPEEEREDIMVWAVDFHI